jgi:hypothetical protein
VIWALPLRASCGGFLSGGANTGVDSSALRSARSRIATSADRGPHALQSFHFDLQVLI